VLLNPNKRRKYDNSGGNFCAASDLHDAYNTAYDELAEIIKRALRETREELQRIKELEERHEKERREIAEEERKNLERIRMEKEQFIEERIAELYRESDESQKNEEFLQGDEDNAESELSGKKVIDGSDGFLGLGKKEGILINRKGDKIYPSDKNYRKVKREVIKKIKESASE